MRETKSELEMIDEAIEKIEQAAKDVGLDFFPTRFEICPADIIYTFGAYGMPTRFSHWSFGKAFYRMKMQYDYNLSRIYELVINSDPCYAFLLEGNSLIQNKLVIAHVFAHCDFFKNNATFSKTSRTMLESMSIAAQRIREMEFEHGRAAVENIIDAAISIQEHVDPRGNIAKAPPEDKNNRVNKTGKPEKAGPYDDLFALDNLYQKLETKPEVAILQEKDVLKYIIKHGRVLEEWQKEIVAIIREEMLYFFPQMETKIMNEGWASYWHARILRSIDLTPDEALDFAVMHSSVIQPSRLTLNPYFLGYKIWEDIEKKWDTPDKEKMFEVRESENDISFLRNYLSDELIDELDLYVYQKVGSIWQIVDKNCERIRNNLVISLTNCGFPYIVVEEGDYNKNGELFLRHCHEGLDLDVGYLERTLPSVYTLWGRSVHLATIMDGKQTIYSYNGEKISKNLKP